MKLRPQVQLRFRDEGQWEGFRKLAGKEALSLNEWILRKLEGVGLTEFNSRVSKARKGLVVESDGSSLAGNQSGQPSAQPGEVIVVKSHGLGATPAVERTRKTGGKLDPAEMVKLSSSEAQRRMREIKNAK